MRSTKLVDPVARSIRSYETRIKNTKAEIRRIRGRADAEVDKLNARIARYNVLMNALKEGSLKP